MALDFSMTVSVRFYLFAEDGLKRISMRVMEELVSGADAMLQYAGTKQKTADVIVEVQDVKPNQIARAEGGFDHSLRMAFSSGSGALLLILAFLCNAGAQQERPFQFITLDCPFRSQMNTTLDHGRLVTTVPKDTLAITLSNFDYDKQTATMVGNAGSDEVSFIPSYKKAVLVQFSKTGNGFMTSISEPADGKAIAFHSRHSWIIGEPVISEYQANCTVRK